MAEKEGSMPVDKLDKKKGKGKADKGLAVPPPSDYESEAETEENDPEDKKEEAKEAGVRQDDNMRKRSGYKYGADVEVDSLTIESLSGEVQDWENSLFAVQFLSKDTIQKVLFMITVRGKDTKKEKKGSRVKFMSTDKRESLYITFANETGSVKSDELTPGRAKVILSTIGSGLWERLNDKPPAVMQIIGYGKLIEEWGAFSKAWDEFLKSPDGKPAAKGKQEGLVTLAGSTKYFKPWQSLMGWKSLTPSNTWILSPVVYRAFMSSPPSVPLGIEFGVGVFELGAVLNLLVDIVSRVKASLKNATADEKARLTTEFCASYLRRSGQRGHVLNNTIFKSLFKTVYNICSPGFVFGSQMGAEVTKLANDAIADALKGAGSNNVPLVFA